MRKNMKRKLAFVGILLIALAMLLAACAVSASAPVTVTIFHTNDMHGRFVESDTAIGIDTIAAIYAAEENAILVDAGDTLHGLPFVNFNQGLNALELMNMAGYSFFTPGNHDFNFGVDRLLELEQSTEFGILAANITHGGEPVFDGVAIREIAGARLGFFGLAYPDTPDRTHPDNVEGLYFGDPVEAARRSVALLEADGADVIIGLTHLGVYGEAWSRRIAEEVQGISLIIDGHSHTLLPEGERIGDVLIVQTGAHSNNLGRVDITVAADGELISMTASVISHEEALENFEPQANISATIERMNAELSEALDVVVGYTHVTFYGDSPEHRETLRSSETPIGNLVADALRRGTGADISMINSGSIRAHLMAGEITKGDIIATLPFFNYAVMVEITPAQLRAALEAAVSSLPGGSFPQISGFAFIFDEAADEGNRLTGIIINGQEIDLSDYSTTFSLAVNDFMAAGGDGFVGLHRLSEAGTLEELLIDYMAQADLANVRVEGRIINLAAPN